MQTTLPAVVRCHLKEESEWGQGSERLRYPNKELLPKEPSSGIGQHKVGIKLDFPLPSSLGEKYTEKYCTCYTISLQI